MKSDAVQTVAPEEVRVPEVPELRAEEEMPLKHRLVHMAVVDVLILAELTAAIYYAKQSPELFTLVFLGIFFGALIPTLILSRLCLRYFVAARPSQAGKVGDSSPGAEYAAQ